jgi:serine/threonine protein kinase
MTERDPLIGRRLANFKIRRLLGHGGMARVYYGLDVTLHRPVAIKVIHEQFRQQKAYLDRFLSEARIVAAWRHKNIAQIYYADEEDDLFYFVMEYIDGLDLMQILTGYTTEGELMSNEDILLVGRGAADALDYAHKRGVVHRDIKPSNIIINRDGQVFLTDFGLAVDVDRDTLEAVFGTAHYVSPEQARSSSSVTAQSDIYSFGVMLFEMLTGVVPFDDPSPLVVALQHLNRAPPRPRTLNPNLSPTTEGILHKALAKDPEERFQSAGELMSHLERALTSERGNVLPDVPLPPIPARSQRSDDDDDESLPTKTITERIATRPKQSITTPRIARETQEEEKANVLEYFGVPWYYWALGLGVFIILILLLLGGFLAMQDRTGATNVAVAVPTETTPPMTASPLPTDTPPPPTATISPSATAAQIATQVLEIPYPNGDSLLLFYDQTSFYLFNNTEVDLLIAPIRFEQIDGQGERAFDGTEWDRFNEVVRAGACMTIRVTDFDEFMHPEACNRIYDATRNAPASHPFVFWVNYDSASHFRVTWAGEEIGRCEIAETACEIFIPPGT